MNSELEFNMQLSHASNILLRMYNAVRHADREERAVRVSNACAYRSLLRRLGKAVAKSGVMKPNAHTGSVDISAVLKVVLPLYNGVNPLREKSLHHTYDLADAFDNNIAQFIGTFDAAMVSRLSNAVRMFLYGRWQSVAWADEVWWRDSVYFHTHALHTSELNAANVAFAESTAKWDSEKFTACKAGRYLQRFFSDVLTEDQIRNWAEKQVANGLPATLHYVEKDNPAGWVNVYRRGPDSCMTGEDCVRIYANPDSVLRLAYLEHNGEIKARCIVRTDDHTYLRAYPNTDSSTNQGWHTAILTAIAKDGYEEQGNLNGVFLDQVPYDNGYVMPYIDRGMRGAQTVSLTACNGNPRFVVCNGGEFDATATSGYIDVGECCEDCDAHDYCEDDMYHTYCGRSVCPRCIDRNYTYAWLRRDQEYVVNEDVVYCEDTSSYYHVDSVHHHAIGWCEESGAWYLLENLRDTSRGTIHFTLCVESSNGVWEHRDYVNEETTDEEKQNEAA